MRVVPTIGKCTAQQSHIVLSQNKKRGQHLGGKSEIYVQYFTALRIQSFNLTFDKKYENQKNKLRRPNNDRQ